MTVLHALAVYRTGWNERMFLVAAHPGSKKEPIMELKKLVSLGFEKNVGTGDRVARLVSGAALVAAGWSLGAPAAACVAMTVFGVMWMATGVLSKCSIYHALGFSTCPVSGETRTVKRPPA